MAVGPLPDLARAVLRRAQRLDVGFELGQA